MLQLLLVLGVLLGAILLVQKVLQASPRAIARKLRSGAVIFALALLVVLAASGRLHWLLVLGGAALAMGSRLLPVLLQSLLYLPLLQRLWRQTRTPAGQVGGANRSNVEARFVRMYLDHDSGEIGGEVLAGRFAGRRLSEMNLSELSRLYEECRTTDAESAELVQAYLDRVHGADWRRAAGANSGAGRGAGNTMNREEAYEILGLRPGASREEIVAAHRRLIQKLHPDRGGSDYLAAKINQAKTILSDDG